MYLRTFSSVVVLGLLTACGAAQTPEPEGDTIDCAIGPGAQFSSDCTLEWIGVAGAQDFLIHHPDGGFRRFTLNENASGIALKDGADELEMVEPAQQGFWQFSVSGDRYLIPIPPASGT
jgi:hypothetical protein